MNAMNQWWVRQWAKKKIINKYGTWRHRERVGAESIECVKLVIKWQKNAYNFAYITDPLSISISEGKRTVEHLLYWWWMLLSKKKSARTYLNFFYQKFARTCASNCKYLLRIQTFALIRYPLACSVASRIYIHTHKRNFCCSPFAHDFPFMLTQAASIFCNWI